mgnify:CR=1 FL=1
MIYFSSSRADTEAYIGAAGELADTWEISGEGWTDMYESYRYSMRWFDGDTPMNTLLPVPQRLPGAHCHPSGGDGIHLGGGPGAD